MDPRIVDILILINKTRDKKKILYAILCVMCGSVRKKNSRMLSNAQKTKQKKNNEKSPFLPLTFDLLQSLC